MGCTSRGLRQATGLESLDPKAAEHMTADAGTRLSALGIYPDDKAVRVYSIPHSTSRDRLNWSAELSARALDRK